MQQALNNMKSMSYTSKLQQATMQMMIQSLMPQEEENRLREMFQQYDIDGDGTLEREEILEGMTKIYGEEKAIIEVDRIFCIADQDGSGKIDFTEFKTAFVQKELLLQEDKLRSMFNFYDKDGGGTISLDEFRDAFVGKQIDE